MKKVLLTLLVMLLVIGLLAPQALAQGELDTIYGAKNHLEMFEAMKSISGLSEQVKKVESLTSEQQNNILTGLFIRRKNPQNLDEFKTFFEEKYKGATTYMAFEPGYPKVQDNGEHGATMTVLTNETGYIYIVAFPDGAVGGINGVKQLMEYYRADNNLYKKRVFVQAGIETTFPISCASYSLGGNYRAYLCLRTENNCYSEFRQINYKVKKINPVIVYKLGNLIFIDKKGKIVVYFIDVMSNLPYDCWEICHYEMSKKNGKVKVSGDNIMFNNPYTETGTYQDLFAYYLSKKIPHFKAHNKFYMSNGTTYENMIYVDYDYKNKTVNVATVEFE